MVSRGPRLVLTGFVASALLAGCGGGAAKFDPVAAKRAIGKNWTTFFNGKTPAATREQLVQNGAALRPTLVLAAKDKSAKDVTATVKGVVIDAKHTGAVVTYDLLISGSPVITGGTGQAVLDNGTWKVSAASFCTLAKLAPGAPKVLPGCPA